MLKKLDTVLTESIPFDSVSRHVGCHGVQGSGCVQAGQKFAFLRQESSSTEGYGGCGRWHGFRRWNSSKSSQSTLQVQQDSKDVDGESKLSAFLQKNNEILSENARIS